MKQIFPKDFLEQSMEVQRFRHGKKLNFAYLLIVVSLCIFLILLPLIHVEVFRSSPGVILSQKKKNRILVPRTAPVLRVDLEENQYVNKGDTLVVLEHAQIGSTIKKLSQQVDTLESFVHDLALLLSVPKKNSGMLKSGLYRSQSIHFLENQKGLQLKYEQYLNHHKRQELLYDKKVISRAEYELSLAQCRSSLNEIRVLKDNQNALWQSALSDSRFELQALRTLLEKNRRERQAHFITAPVSGTVHGLLGFEKSSLLRAGEVIAEISPDDKLRVECFVSPSDIGLLRKNLPVKFRIHAFHHHLWGMATGVIKDVHREVVLKDDRPFFRVICSINEKALHLKDDTPGRLRKGMTLQASFFIARRSLLQLLFDRMEDWYSPVRS